MSIDPIKENGFKLKKKRKIKKCTVKKLSVAVYVDDLALPANTPA